MSSYSQYTTITGQTVSELCTSLRLSLNKLLEINNTNVSNGLVLFYDSTITVRLSNRSNTTYRTVLTRNTKGDTPIDVAVLNHIYKFNKDTLELVVEECTPPETLNITIRYASQRIYNISDYLRYANSVNARLSESLTIKIPADSLVKINSKSAVVNRPGTVDGGLLIDKNYKQCTIKRYTSGKYKDKKSLPIIPEEISVSNSASFDSVSMLGRSVDYQVYNGSNRSVSLSLTLHADLLNYYKIDIRDVVSYIESCNYPQYSENKVGAPEISFSTNNIYIKGILKSCEVSWKLPVIDNVYQLCTLSLGIQETKGPYSMSEIQSMKGRNTQDI